MNKFRSKNKYIKIYIEELSRLVNSEFNEADLSSSELLEKIRTAHIDRENGFKIQIPFSDKSTLKKLIDELCLISSSDGIYIVTDYSNYCGALFLNSICEFNSNFNFSDEHAGIVTIISQDLENELVLDFSEEDHRQILEIEVYGKIWPIAREVITIKS